MGKESNTIWSSGTRKTSIAQIRLFPGNGKIIINGMAIEDYFGGLERQKTKLLKPFNATGSLTNYDIIGKVYGGGITGQSDALCLGISRALAKLDDKKRRILRKEGFLTRDARMVERKKPGQPKARKRFQYSKR